MHNVVAYAQMHNIHAHVLSLILRSIISIFPCYDAFMNINEECIKLGNTNEDISIFPKTLLRYTLRCICK